MITKLKISNFKSHKDTEINLSNLTVLTGVNGSGKTSIIQSLLLLRQSFVKTRLMYGIDLNYPLCTVGIGDDALYKLANESVITFEIWEGNELLSFSFDTKDSLDKSFLPLKEYSKNIDRTRLEQLPLFNTHFQYISTNRWGGKSTFPRDDYEAVQQHQISLNLGQGELVAHYLFNNAANDSFNYLFDEKNYSLIDQVVAWEERISPNVFFDVQKGFGGTTFSLLYGYRGDEKHKTISGLRAENIGFGISYSLPIIVALISAQPGDLIIIENPEAHLHPAAQAELARLISRVASNGIQIIVETHSDHIINGILIATKLSEQGHHEEIGLEKTKIYFWGGKDADHAAIKEEVLFEGGGHLKYQPKGFFDQEEKDLLHLYSL